MAIIYDEAAEPELCMADTLRAARMHLSRGRPSGEPLRLYANGERQAALLRAEFPGVEVVLNKPIPLGRCSIWKR